jgi:hypothetical protein
MQTEFNQRKLDMDRSIKQAAAERPGKPIRLRLQPMVLRSVGPKGGQYHAWKDVRWLVECDNAAEAYATRDALRAFFDTLAVIGPAETQQVLKAARAAAGDEASPAVVADDNAV